MHKRTEVVKHLTLTAILLFSLMGWAGATTCQWPSPGCDVGGAVPARIISGAVSCEVSAAGLDCTVEAGDTVTIGDGTTNWLDVSAAGLTTLASTSGQTLQFKAGGANRWGVSSGGTFFASVDGAVNIGFNNTGRPSSVFIINAYSMTARDSAFSNPGTDQVLFYAREDIDLGAGAATADCGIVARAPDGTEVTMAVVKTDAGC